MLVVYCGICSMLNYYFSLNSYLVQSTVSITKSVFYNLCASLTENTDSLNL